MVSAFQQLPMSQEQKEQVQQDKVRDRIQQEEEFLLQMWYLMNP